MSAALSLLLDEREIGRALTRFARAMDARDWDAAKAILSENATGELGTGSLSGPDAIIGCIRHYLDGCGPTQHLLGNLLIEITGDTAESRCYVSDMHLGAGDRRALSFVTLGDYHDSWQRIEGAWRLTHRSKINNAHLGSFEVFGLDR
jgi:hypothetical protein